MRKKIINYEAGGNFVIFGGDGGDRDESVFYASERDNTSTVQYDT